MSVTPTGGWVMPPDHDHVAKYPLGLVLGAAPARVETIIALPEPARFREYFDQKQLNACVGYSACQYAAIRNGRGKLLEYGARQLWERAKALDGLPDTNPGDNNGTLIRTALEILRKEGPVLNGKARPAHGIAEYRWARSVDEVRSAVAAGNPVVVGTAWYAGMSQPQKRGGEFWMSATGARQFGHAWLIVGCSDRRQAVFTCNTWGGWWPGDGAGGAWWPYEEIARRLPDQMEAAVIVDKPAPKPKKKGGAEEEV